MCIFCKIVSGEIPSYKLYEDENFLAILDISQATIGHTLIIPKKHVETIFDLSENDAAKAFRIVARMAKRLKNTLNLQAINILNNNGALAGQSVGHFHIHLIPRYPDDHLMIRFSENKMTDEEFRKLATTISAAKK